MNKKYEFARYLRRNQTEAEKIVWSMLRNRNFHNLKFKRQMPIGKYIVDFVCVEHNIIIELDGGQHNESLNKENDKLRTKYLENLGYKVVRFWDNDVINNIEGVYQKLEEYFE